MGLEKYILALAATALISSCDLAPDFKKPETSVPAEFKNIDTKDTSKVADGSWKKVELNESTNRGNWWKVFADEDLNKLQEKALANNQELAAVAAKVEQARALAGVAKADYFPSMNVGAGPASFAQSNAFTGRAQNADINEQTSFKTNATISYEPDLFGRVKNSTKSAEATAEAQTKMMESIKLALQADLAQNYFNIRSIDFERNLLKETVKLYEKSEKMMKARFEQGDIPDQEYMRSKTESATAKAELISLNKRRAELENAIAVLVGEVASNFKIEEKTILGSPPKVPAGLPSKLLERRPDISAAADNMAGANAKIGVARAAFFPSISLTASGGFESNELGDLFKWSSRTWALGPMYGTLATLPIFEGGRGFRNLDFAKAGYTASVATYRQQVLVAFKEVEDAIAAIRYLNEQEQELKKAADSARRASDLSKLRYEKGYTSYLEVVDANRASLSTDRALAQVRGARFNASVALIRALGGGWE
jgi:multidrug efflux system outer membrane protein